MNDDYKITCVIICCANCGDYTLLDGTILLNNLKDADSLSLEPTDSELDNIIEQEDEMLEETEKTLNILDKINDRKAG